MGYLLESVGSYADPTALDVSFIQSFNSSLSSVYYCRSILGMEGWPSGCWSHDR